MQRGYSLSKLLKAIQPVGMRGEVDVPVHSLVSDSREVTAGSLFFAFSGIKRKGHEFIDEAISRGAVGVVSSEALPKHPPVAYIQVADARLALVAIAKIFYKKPQQALKLVAVTGTKGKTTTSILVEHLLGFPEVPVGLLGTVRYDLGKRTLPVVRATPDTADLWHMLAEMRDQGCRHAVIEVTSYGIEQGRVLGVPFECVIFTNLSHDHLDYHGSMEQYFACKTRLFSGDMSVPPKFAAINLDDAYGKRLVEMLPTGVRAITFGIDNPNADLRFEASSMNLLRSTGNVITRDGKAYPCVVPLPGKYNQSNALAALAACMALGYRLEPLIERLASSPGVPGRMELVPTELPIQVFVDYAHSPDPIVQVLQTLRPLTSGKLHIVFGCGGDRDRLKRPVMLSMALSHADCIWATSDNPRHEPQSQIFEDMRRNVPAAEKAIFIQDRREAIAQAIDAMQPGDTLVIAGKGHEAFQEFADHTVSFSDRLVAEECLSAKRFEPSELSHHV